MFKSIFFIVLTTWSGVTIFSQGGGVLPPSPVTIPTPVLVVTPDAIKTANSVAITTQLGILTPINRSYVSAVEKLNKQYFKRNKYKLNSLAGVTDFGNRFRDIEDRIEQLKNENEDLKILFSKDIERNSAYSTPKKRSFPNLLNGKQGQLDEEIQSLETQLGFFEDALTDYGSMLNVNYGQVLNVKLFLEDKMETIENRLSQLETKLEANRSVFRTILKLLTKK